MNEDIIAKFYTAFKMRKHEDMNYYYNNNSLFIDEIFELKGAHIKAMWHMLCERGKDLIIEYDNIQVVDNKGSADWTAEYTFTATGRKVINKIHAEFEFKDGKILKHTDHFSFYKWSAQAIGIPGILLGWTPILKNKVQKQANDSLLKFIERHPEYQE